MKNLRAPLTQKQLLTYVVAGGITIVLVLAFLSSPVSKSLLGIQLASVPGFASYSAKQAALSDMESNPVFNCVTAPCPGDPGSTDPGQFLVTSPVQKEIWQTGQTQKIMWQSPVMDPSYVAYRVSITLEKPTPDCALYTKPQCDISQISPYVIASRVENSGQYSWTIPDSISAGYLGEARIVVKINDTNLEARSGLFTLQKGTPGAQVTSPANGDRWKMGSSYKIVWNLPEKQTTSAAKANKISITLKPASNCTPPSCSEIVYYPPFQIASDLPNTGVYVWKVSEKLDPKYFGQQQITVSIQNTDQSAQSSSFYIDGPSVTGSQPQIVNATMPPASASQAYTLRFEAKGGQSPYRWAAIVSNNLTGYQINQSTGVFTANITRVGAYTVVVTVTDSTGGTSMKRFSWQVNAVSAAHSDGSFVYGLDGIPSSGWLIENGKRRPFPTGEAYMSHGYKWESFVPANKGDQALPVGEGFTLALGTLIKPGGSLNLCLVYPKLEYRCFNSNAVLRRMGYTSSMAYNASQQHLVGSGYREGQAITDVIAHPTGTDIISNGTIYRVTATGRKPYTSVKIYNTWHTYNNDFSKVVPANDLDLARPQESAMQSRY